MFVRDLHGWDEARDAILAVQEYILESKVALPDLKYTPWVVAELLAVDEYILDYYGIDSELGQEREWAFGALEDRLRYLARL